MCVGRVGRGVCVCVCGGGVMPLKVLINVLFSVSLALLCFLDLYLSKCKTVKLGDQLTGTWAFGEVAFPTTQQSRGFHNGEKEDEEHLRERERDCKHVQNCHN